MATAFDRAVDRHVRRLWLAFGEELRRLREDAGLSRAALARAAGVDSSYLGDVEDGRAQPSAVICARLTMALGADLTLRAYPTTGPTVRDRHQAAIVESILGLAHPRWRRFAEIAVRHPSRGWIDLGLHDPIARQFVATEIQSELRRLEQLLRWSEAKATALPSWDGWGQLGEAPAVSRLLVVRDTRTTRAVAADFRRLLRTAFPADPVEALVSLQAWGRGRALRSCGLPGIERGRAPTASSPGRSDVAWLPAQHACHVAPRLGWEPTPRHSPSSRDVPLRRAPGWEPEFVQLCVESWVGNPLSAGKRRDRGASGRSADRGFEAVRQNVRP